MKTNERMRKVFSILLCLCMVLSCIPTAVFAVTVEDGLCGHHTEHTADCGYAASACTYHCCVCHVQGLVDALPGEVTADNAEAVRAQLTAIDSEKASLSDEELAQVDFTKYTAAAEALGSVDAATPAETTYSVTVENTYPAGGTVTADKETAAAGDTVTLTVTPKDGYEIGYVYVNNTITPTLQDNGTYTFTMPDADAEVLCSFTFKSYTVTVDSEITNGTVTVSAGNSKFYQQEFTITVTPNAGYTVESVTMTTNGDATVQHNNVINSLGYDLYYYTMPADDVIVTATFKEYEATYAVSFEVTNATSDGAATATAGTNYTATLTANEGYTLPDTLNILINTLAIQAGMDYTYDSSTGNLTIYGSKITGRIEIYGSADATGGEQPGGGGETGGDGAYDVTFAVTNATSNGAATATAGTDYTAKLTANEGYTLPDTLNVLINAVAINAGTDYTYDKSTGVLTIYGDKITGNIGIYGSAVATGGEQPGGEQHTHNLAYKYSDGTGHWQECSDADCPDTDKGKTATTTHDFDDDSDTTCDTCGYTRTIDGGDGETGGGTGGETTYTVTWKIGEATWTTEVACGDEITEFDVPDADIPENYYGSDWDTEIPETMPAEDITIEGHWTVYVSFNTAGGDFISFKQYPVGQELYLNPASNQIDPYEAGYDVYFLNTLDETGQEKYRIESDGINHTWPTVTLTGNLNLKPIYEPAARTITWKIGEAAWTTRVVCGEAITEYKVPDADIPENYYGYGWDTEIPATMPTENITIEGHWTACVIYITEDGTSISMNPYPVGQKLSLNPASDKIDPYRAGYDVYFLNILDETGQEKYKIESDGSNHTWPTVTLTGNLKLKPIYEPVTYTITWKVDGNPYDTTEVKYGGTITEPENPTKEKEGCTAFTFAGWVEEIPATMPASDLTFTASFTESASHTPGYSVDEDADTITYGCSVCGANAETVTLTAPDSLIADGKAKQFTYTGSISGVTPKITYSQETIPADAGTYTVTMSITVDGETYSVSRKYTILESQEEDLTDYKIIKGSRGYVKGSYKPLSFSTDGPDSKFAYIEVDGNQVDAKHYTVASDNGTVITLKAGYLENLSAGKHTIQVFYADGKTDTATFRISINNGNPFTGDNSHMMLFGGVAMTSLLCMAMMVMFLSRKKGKYER